MNRILLVPAVSLAFFSALPTSYAQPVEATSASPSDETVQLSPFEVSSQGDKGYNSANTVGATVVNMPIMQVPMSIDVVNKQLMADVGMVDPAYAASYISGVVPAADPDGGQLVIRGQDLNAFQQVRDGVPDLVVESQQFNDSALYERLEIIKGPEGTIYGTFSAQGGLANYITKEPQSAPATSLSFMYGADELGGKIGRSVLDTTGAVTGHPEMLYRLVVEGQNGLSLQGGPDNSFLFAPMGTYTFKGGGALLLRWIYYNPHRDTQAHGWFIDDTGAVSTFIPASYSVPDLQTGRDFRINKLDLRFTQPFTTGPIDWSAQVYCRYGDGKATSQYQEPSQNNFLFLNAAGQTIGNSTNTAFSNPNLATIEVTPRVYALFHDGSYLYVDNFDLVGKVQSGPIKNQFVMYGDFLRQFTFSLDYSGTYPGMILWSSIPNYPGVNFHTGNEYTNSVLTGPLSITTNTRVTNTLMGAGGQDNLSVLNDRLTFVVGIRDDRQNQTTYNYVAGTPTPNDVRKGVTRKYAVVAQPLEWLSLFYNYSQTFTPQGFASNQFGQTYKIPNLNSTIYEEGAKLGLLHNRISVTSSYFRTIVQNATVLVTEYNSVGVPIAVTVPAGQQIIRGWETDATMVITNNLDLIGGAGNLNSKTATGLAARAVPFGTNYRAFLKYTFDTGLVNGLYLGFGLEHNGPRAADAADDATLPPYTVCNALAGYTFRKHWQVQVNVNNVFNEVYAQIAVARQIIYASNPTDASVTLTYRF